MMDNFDDLVYTSSLEKKLSESLRPLHPDPMFIHSLREKLSQTSNVMVEKQVSHPALWVLGAGLVTGVLLVLLTRRFKG